MNFKDKVKAFFNEFKEEITYNEQADFNATFEDHELGKQKYYRLQIAYSHRVRAHRDQPGKTY